MIVEKAYAKLNLALTVVGKRKDGFHELKSIAIPISLHDVLEFYSSEEISVESDVDIKDNLILKTAQKMQERWNIKEGAKIKLTKRIPIGGGLGGESADISATIRGLNRLWSLNLELEDFHELATSLGSDTLFCLYNKPALIYGRGEGILFINQPSNYDIFLFPFAQGIKTKEVFENHQIKVKKNRFDRLFRLYLNEQYQSFFKKTYNDLMKTAFRLNKDLKKQHSSLKKIHKNVFMSGSGTTLFIMAETNERPDIINKIEKINLDWAKSEPKS
ncbi:MAG: 4-(cytidine 5'-diphospho)-2-C-methyl-D-erythritol kinase [Acholeplasmataceae bacterium]